MTALELMMLLQEAIDGNEGQDFEVRLATQPTWPFENTVSHVKLVKDDEADTVMYLCEGTQIGYAARSLWSEE